MPVQSYDIDEHGQPIRPPQPVQPKRPRANRPLETAVLSGGCLSRAFLLLITATLWGLVILSVLGTFYGARGLDAPITTPLQVIADIAANPITFVIAFAGQAALGIAQWGGRQQALRDPRWWPAYIIALVISVRLNWIAYGDGLITLFAIPWLLALLIIAAGDIFPEWMLVRDEPAART